MISSLKNLYQEYLTMCTSLINVFFLMRILVSIVLVCVTITIMIEFVSLQIFTTHIVLVVQLIYVVYSCIDRSTDKLSVESTTDKMYLFPKLMIPLASSMTAIDLGISLITYLHQMKFGRLSLILGVINLLINISIWILNQWSDFSSTVHAYSAKDSNGNFVFIDYNELSLS